MEYWPKDQSPNSDIVHWHCRSLRSWTSVVEGATLSTWWDGMVTMRMKIAGSLPAVCHMLTMQSIHTWARAKWVLLFRYLVTSVSSHILKESFSIFLTRLPTRAAPKFVSFVLFIKLYIPNFNRLPNSSQSPCRPKRLEARLWQRRLACCKKYRPVVLGEAAVDVATNRSPPTLQEAWEQARRYSRTPSQSWYNVGLSSIK